MKRGGMEKKSNGEDERYKELRRRVEEEGY